MRYPFLLFLSLLTFCFLSACTESNPWEDPEFRAEYLKQHVKTRYEFTNASPDLETAVERYVGAMLDPQVKNGYQQYALDEAEYTEKFWPNLPEKWTGNIHLKPSDSWEMEVEKRPLGVQRIRTEYFPGAVEVLEVAFRRPSEQYNAIQVHFPGDIMLRDSRGNAKTTDLVRAVLEHRGQFKVVHFGP